MPKASSKTRAGSARKDPIAKPAIAQDGRSIEPTAAKDAKASGISSSKRTKDAAKDPAKEPAKTSHLYTDDNPTTTLTGTGFKDASTATHTLSLISRRSLTYQFQTINTLLHRAANHPSMKKGPTDANAEMRAAIDVYRHWIDDTYPAAKTALRAGGFKPLLSKGRVEAFVDILGEGEGRGFAEMYTKLGKNKRLGNVLLDDSEPGEADWERKRYDTLCALVPEGKEEAAGWSEDELWADGKASKRHLELIAWAWSPVPERKLPKGTD